MRLKKKILLSSLVSLSAIAVSTAIVVPLVVASQNKPVSPITPEQKKIFNINGDTVYGFNTNVSSNDVQKYIDDNNGLLLPSVKAIAPYAFEQFNKKLGLKNNTLALPIPATIEAIPEHAFYDSDVTSITFEKGSKCHTIGKSAFAFCKSLTSVQIPSGVVTTEATKGIKERAFYCCEALSTLDFTTADNIIPSGKDSVLGWDSDAFIRTPETGKILFNITSKQISVDKAGATWSRLVKSGLNHNWTQCKANGDEITYPCKPIPYESYIFEDHDKKVLIDVSSSGIQEGVFNTTIIPSEITNIKPFVASQRGMFRTLFESYNISSFNFEYCDSIQKLPDNIFGGLATEAVVTPTITLPPKLTEIGESAFVNSKVIIKGLDKLIGTGGTLQTIDESAFRLCNSESLKSLTFRTGITIKTDAFVNIPTLHDLNIVAYGKKPPEGEQDTWAADCFKSTDSYKAKRVVHLKQDEKKNILEQWRIAQTWLPWFPTKGIVISDDEWSIQPKGSQLKYDDIFKVVNGECQGFIRGNDGKVPEWSEFEKLLKGKKTLTFPKTVTKIADNAFINDDGTSTIPNNLINYIDFKRDSEGNPSKITSIGKNAFKNMPVTVDELWFGGSALKTIGESAFENAQIGKISGLNEMTSVTTIGKRAFYACTKVSHFSKDEANQGKLLLDKMTGLTTIGDDAFARWDEMWKITDDGAILKLNKELTSIGRGAFYGNKFNIIEIPKFNGEITIGNNAFAKDTTEDKYQLKQIKITEYTDVPTWKINDYAYLFAGVGSSGKITVSSDTLYLRLDKIWNYFAGQSEEIKRNPDRWVCERAQ